MDFCKPITCIIGFNFLIILLISCVSGGQEGECRRKVWRDNIPETEVYCCTNFEMSNGTCIMCRKGFVSKDGKSCQACTGNSYGTQCLLSCECTENQICHHVAGCIKMQLTSFETRPEVSTAVSSWISTSDIVVDERESTEPSHGPVSVNQSVLIYTTCIAALLVVISICYICINRLRYKSTEQIEIRNRQSHQIQHAPNLILPIPEIMVRHESVYDEIDELSINHDNVLQKRHSSKSYESSLEETSEGGHEHLMNEDYLNPYQPIVKDHERHYYKTITDNASGINLDNIDVNGTVHKGNENILLGIAVNVHDYLEVFDSSREDQTKVCNSSQRVNTNKNNNQETSQFTLCMSTNDKLKHVDETLVVSYPVSAKRLTI